MLDFSNGASPSNIAIACGGKLLYEGTKRISGACIDSRSVNNGDIFVAIKGTNTDGHNYVKSAAEKGASAVLVEREPDDLKIFEDTGCSVILCESTSLSLASLSSAHKAECKATTVGVTGSVGKTTTRQYIASVLSSRFDTHKTEGNFNNALGLPLTLLKLKDTHQASVVELGMSAKGEISFLTKLARPDIAVITAIGSSHIEHLGSREGIRDAKLEIVEGLKDGGKLILNGDEPLLEDIDGAVYVSLKNELSDYRALNIRYTPSGMLFDAITPSSTLIDCSIPTLGEHTVLDAMYAVCIGDILGLTEDEIKEGLLSFEGVGMRQNIKTVNGITYIHDYYNASPESIKASLSVTKKLSDGTKGRAVAVIGNVLELGELSEKLHRSVASSVLENGISLLFTFGSDAAYIADEAVKLGFPKDSVSVFYDTIDPMPIAEAVKKALKPNDCVLIKASHGLDMKRIADLL